ncbi:hypothetical protein CTI14_69450, partial [Methylobacterium radiotolerans]
HHLHRRGVGIVLGDPDLRLHQPLHQDPPVGAARIIGKVEADSQPIIYIAVESGSFSAIQTSDYINRYIKTRLSVLPG